MKFQGANGAKPASPQEDYLLDESYVLDIIVCPGLVIFKCDLALTERHPLYERPKADEAFCFRSGEIIWSEVREVIWSGQGAPPATDASGEIDYGHIDSLAADGQDYDLEGDWGRMNLTAGIFAIKLT